MKYYIYYKKGYIIRDYFNNIIIIISIIINK